MLAERKYAQPSQLLKGFLKEIASIWAEGPYGIEGTGLRDFYVSGSQKFH